MLQPRPDTAERPLATYALLALCVAVFVPLHLAHRSTIRDGLRTLQRAEQYLADHAYLRTDPRLAQVLGRGSADPSTVRGGAFDSLEQAELDGMVGGGFDVLARVPHWRWGLVPAAGSPLALVSHLFLHAGWLSLAVNLLLLWFAGSYLEARWSPALVAGAFLLPGVIGGVAFVALHPEFPVPLLGASAGVAGVLGAFAATHAPGRVAVGYWLGPDRAGEWRVPALALCGAWVVREAVALVSPEVLVPPGGSAAVVYGGHLAGFAAGAVAGAALRLGRWEARLGARVPAALEVPAADPAERALAAARAAREQGRTGEAWQLLLAAARAAPGDAAAVDALWDLAVAEGRTADAAAAVVRLVHQLSRSSSADEAHRRWSELRARAPGARVPVGTEVRLARALNTAGRTAAAGEVAAVAAGHIGPRELPGTLADLARLLSGEARQRVLRMALAHPDLPAQRRTELEGLRDRPATGRPPGTSAAGPGPAAAGAPPHAAPEAGPELQVMYAAPVGVQKGHLGLELRDGGRRVVPVTRIRGLAGAQVYDGGVEPEYLLDLVLEYPRNPDLPAGVIRLHCQHFDPRKLVPTEPEVGDALLSLAGQLLTASGGTWLLGAHPTELRSYDSPADHRRELLAALRLNAGGN